MAFDDGERLLRAVCEHPGDDTPRLVLADHFDDHDQPERAAFIRREVARFQAEDIRLWEWPAVTPWITRLDRHGNQRWYWGAAGNTKWWRAGEIKAACKDIPVLYSDSHDNGLVYFSRGFPHTVHCTAADWLAHADALAWPPAEMVCPRCGKTAIAGEVLTHDPPTKGRPEGSWSPKKCPAGCVKGRLILPRPTDPCDNPQCENCGGRGTSTADPQNWEWGNCRTPRSFTGREQPVEKVTLTTWPEEEGDDAAMVFRFPGRTMLHPYVFGRGVRQRVADMLAAEWPWIEFEVAPATLEGAPDLDLAAAENR